MNEDVPRLRITSSMSLEQAMLEVRRYLATKSGSAGDQPASTRTAAVRSAHFNAQAALASRLSEIAARLGQVEPNSKFGAPGVLLKRVVHKVVGWYLRPEREFDRAAIELLRQVRLDMVDLQQQIATLQDRVSIGASAPSAVSQQATQPREQHDAESENRQALALMIELFKNVTAVRALRQALRHENPELLLQVERLLDSFEDESNELKAALTRSLEAERR